MLFAPAMVYASSEESATLIAGHSLEINATTPIEAFVSLSQLKLISQVVEDISRGVVILQKLNDSGLRSSLITKEVLDSGVDCEETSSMGPLPPSSVLVKSPIPRSFVPTEVLITGSKLTLTVFRKWRVEEAPKVSLKVRIFRFHYKSYSFEFIFT